MIDQKVFLQELGILMDWFNRDFEEATLKRLHHRLSAHLTTEQFVQAAHRLSSSLVVLYPSVDG